MNKTFGGPYEFRFPGTFIGDYQPLIWSDDYLRNTMLNNPGLYDDLYMDLTFVDVFEKHGLNAPVDAFANAFANAGYAVVLFDYRGFGGSTGKPRELVSPSHHLEDWRAVLNQVKKRKDIDVKKINGKESKVEYNSINNISINLSIINIINIIKYNLAFAIFITCILHCIIIFINLFYGNIWPYHISIIYSCQNFKF